MSFILFRFVFWYERRHIEEFNIFPNNFYRYLSSGNIKYSVKAWSYKPLPKNYKILTDTSFSYRGFLHRHWRFTGQQEKEEDHLLFHSTTSTRSQTLFYLQFCLWDDYHVLLIATLVFTRLLLNDIYHLIEIPFEWLIDDAMFVCSLDELVLGFCYSDFTLGTGGFELASTITLVLQAKSTNQVC